MWPIAFFKPASSWMQGLVYCTINKYRCIVAGYSQVFIIVVLYEVMFPMAQLLAAL